MTTFTFKTRNEYLTQRAEWKADYKALSQTIRDLKGQRKQYTWKYVPKGKNIKMGDNPRYDSTAGWSAVALKYKATKMLEDLAEAKIEAGKQREYRIANEQEAAAA